MADLVVELSGARVGRLSGDWRTFDFVADPHAIERYGIDSLVISVAMPLAAISNRARRDRRQNFFHELLPEGQMLRQLAQQAGVPPHDVIGLLRAFGRDLAGALQIWDPDRPGEPLQPAVVPLTDHDVAIMLKEVRRDPLGNQVPTGKTSLAGVQDKIVLVRNEMGWNRALDGWPSSHIVKPESRDYPTMIYDEEYGSRFARMLGLTTFATSLETFDGVPAIVIERYDRSPETPDGRIHQEDFNQALGASGNEKYQRFGGRVSLANIARVIATAGGHDSLTRLFKLVALSIAVGNLDLHAKNISLLHFQDGSIELAPAYDVVPQAHLPNDRQVALAIGGEYQHAALTKEMLVAEGISWGLRTAEVLADTTLEQVLELARGEHPDDRAHPGLAEDIATFTSNLLQGRSAGRPASAERSAN